MDELLKAEGVGKKYPPFALKDIGFSVRKGFITGLIGPNGAGKTTLIKMMLGMVKPDEGRMTAFGDDTFLSNGAYKSKIGYVSDENFYYEQLTISTMTRMLSPFYPHWNEKQFQHYIKLFQLPVNKKIKTLSKGMKMKFSLAVALSHGAELLIMDEPTAGLDPVFRRELLDLLAGHIQDEEKAILFSTHNTADLDRIADYIVFVNDGRLVLEETKEDLYRKYRIVKGTLELLDRDTRALFLGLRETPYGFEGLMDGEPAQRYFGDLAVCERPSLEDIMVFSVQGRRELRV